MLFPPELPFCFSRGNWSIFPIGSLLAGWDRAWPKVSYSHVFGYWKAKSMHTSICSGWNSVCLFVINRFPYSTEHATLTSTWTFNSLPIFLLNIRKILTKQASKPELYRLPGLVNYLFCILNCSFQCYFWIASFINNQVCSYF